ncbi:MAG TPA: transketolase C-terminal domain-containing protein [Bacteriovoracaceae bacterium]|nr:transketolase C-terminal domain-containing protein [Bacteriovoracaceae bacterium]
MSLKPLNIQTKLFKAPTAKPMYSVTIKDSQGNEISLADPRATRSLLALMDQAAVNGGAACHWGGPSAMTEAWTALHGIMFKKEDWFNHFNFVNDIGHAENGIYALRAVLGFGDLSLETLKGFRSIHSKLTGHGESHLYPEGVLLSNGPLASAFPQAQGLAVADRITGNERVTVCSLSDGAAMEGEAKEALSAIPGLASAGKLNPFVLLLSDNNTKLSGRIDTDAYSMLPSFKAIKTLGWKVVEVENAHDLEVVYQTIEKAIEDASSNPKKPVCVWLKTVKGYGIKATADSTTGGHGFPLKAYDEGIHAFLQELYGKEKVPAEFTAWANELTVKPEKKSSSTPSEKIQVGISNGMIRAAKAGYPVFSISSDLQGSTGTKGFQSEFKDHFLDVGVAESNMVSTAIGMSKLGYIPVVDTFAAFGVTKGNLPLIMSSLSQAPVIAVFSHTGFQDAADGASHQSLTYLSALASIPHLNIVNLSTSREADEYMYQAIEKIAKDREAGKDGESYIFFLGRENFVPENKEGLSYELHKAQRIIDGKDVALIATGSVVPKAIKAAELLAQEGISATVISYPFVNNTDMGEIATWIQEASSKVITVEDHQLIAGMGAQLTHELKRRGLEFDYIAHGVNREFGQSAYTADELYAKHNLDEMAIVRSARELVSRKSSKNLDVLLGMIEDKFGINKDEAIKKVEEIIRLIDASEFKDKATKTAGMLFNTAHSILDQVKSKIQK